MLAWANHNLIRYLRVPACGERHVRGLVLRLLSDHVPSVHCVPRVRALVPMEELPKSQILAHDWARIREHAEPKITRLFRRNVRPVERLPLDVDARFGMCLCRSVLPSDRTLAICRP
jgi:hypothetical protein